jgi:hypothetical protein
LRALQIGEDARDRSRPRIAAVPKVEDKPRISHRFAAEAGWRGVALSKESFYFSQQMHWGSSS